MEQEIVRVRISQGKCSDNLMFSCLDRNLDWRKMDIVRYISFNRDSALERISGKDASDESRAEVEKNIRAKHSALSAVAVNDSS